MTDKPIELRTKCATRRLKRRPLKRRGQDNADWYTSAAMRIGIVREANHAQRGVVEHSESEDN
jgi:hypothetical protein